MNNNNKPRFTSKDLSVQITERIHELAEATDAARMSEEMMCYLDLCAKFHRYSPQNVWLILMSKPDASMVAGFKKWRSMGRYVRKGEQGIPILAPVLVKVKDEGDDEEDKLVGFRVVYVFDVSQTDGEPLPKPPNWKSPERMAFLEEELIQFANSKGITVQVKELAGDTQGVSKGGEVVLSPAAGTKTLIHEIAHELMHRDDGRQNDKSILELEAESVAYVVARHFGLDELSSPNYVALHGASAELILEHLEHIHKTATQIIIAIETEDDSQ